MSAAAPDPHYDYGSPLAAAAAAAPAERELAVRTARRDGRELVTLRCVERGAEFVVECVVHPATGLRVEPLRPGPYRFADWGQASAFMDEAMLALAHLGCDVS